MAQSFAAMHDIGTWLSAETALIPTVITAGAGNDGVEVNGPVFDRLSTGRGLGKSCKLVIFGVATLAAAATLTITANLQDDTALAFNAAPADLETVYPVTIVRTGAVTNGTFRAELDIDIQGAKRYIRAQITANLSAASVDTCAIAAVFVLGGQQNYPAT
jgi:hypothetical protein